MRNKFSITILFILTFASCGHIEQNNSVLQKNIPDTLQQINIDTSNHKNEVRSNDLNYYSDSVFHGIRKILSFYFKKYSSDTCFLWNNKMNYTDSFGVNEFNKIRQLGIVHNNIETSVFVLDKLSWCSHYQKLYNEEYEDGQAYYFTDTTLPRLQSDSYCCHPSNIFIIGDIDDDGVAEIGQYFSSCASHYKSIIVWTLKNNSWNKVGHSIFDQHYMKYDKPFSSYVRKLSKGKFEMYEKTDLSSDSTNAINGHWIKFSM